MRDWSWIWLQKDIMNNSSDGKTWNLCVHRPLQHKSSPRGLDMRQRSESERKDWWIVLWVRWNGSIWRGRHLCLPLCLSLGLLPLSKECRREAKLSVCQGCHMHSSQKSPLFGRKTHTHTHTYNHIIISHHTNKNRSLPSPDPSVSLFVSVLLSHTHSCHTTTVSLWFNKQTHTLTHRHTHTHTHTHTLLLSLHSRNGGERCVCVNRCNIINVCIHLMAPWRWVL